MMNEETHTEACGNEPEELTRESEVSADAEVVDSDQQSAPLSDEAIAALVETAEGELGHAIRQLLEERSIAREDRLRALAEVSNNQRRAAENERRVEQASRARVYRGVLPVLDQMEMALDQDLDTVSPQQLAEGVRIARDELAKTLAEQGVEPIEPKVGDAFDPIRHEAMMRQEAEGVESNHIVMVMQSGYVMGEQVLRPAKVAVSP
ncbi:MAG: nucleotide exchange factor GrpE [Phycisphaerae bacterium]|nr:nucleotide exchange factor GrpE [Phycisphaerae bacterium]|tara:strand:+ start:265 stop:885 length:621 start_codon:yes stop_codon:yes gene_type:complete